MALEAKDVFLNCRDSMYVNVSSVPVIFVCKSLDITRQYIQ